MRILVLNYEYPPLGGGGGVVAAHLAECLAAEHEVVVVTSGAAGLPGLEEANGVEVHRVRVWGRTDRDAATMVSLLTYPGAAIRRANVLTGERRFDLVHGHFAVPTGIASLPVARRAGLPHVLSLHGGDVYDPSKWSSPHRHAPVRKVVDRVLGGSDAVVATSTNIRDVVRRHYEYSGPIEIIPLGIPIPEGTGATARRPRAGGRPLRLVTVGRLVGRKGVDRLLRALTGPHGADTELTVVGGGPELTGLRTLAGELGLTGRVSFAGRVDEDEKWRILGRADGYVSAASHEGFGLVFLEAMAAGLPVVAFDHGGHTDFLEDGRTGFLVRAGDTEGLAAAIGRLARDREVGPRMGEDNRRRVQAYRIDRCARAYASLFDRVVERRLARHASRFREAT